MIEETSQECSSADSPLLWSARTAREWSCQSGSMKPK
nr:MAG TPA: hypothetical protein [Caudoviricetes sp.]